MSQILSELLKLSHQLGDPAAALAILGEGNTSARLDGERFLVKASGTSLGTLSEQDVVECAFDRVLPFLGDAAFTDEEVNQGLLGSRLRPEQKKPSVEALFHAYLLSLPGINFVGHTHPIAANAFLCGGRGTELASQRIFPDEIVCCGDASVLVPYTDPGVHLARAIKAGVEKFRADYAEVPRVILLENHGVITLGGTPQAVLAAMLMCEKAATIRIGAASVGKIHPLSAENIRRISSRPDEHERRRALNI